MRRTSKIKRSLDYVTRIVLITQFTEDQDRPLRHDLMRPPTEEAEIEEERRALALAEEMASDPELARELGVA